MGQEKPLLVRACRNRFFAGNPVNCYGAPVLLLRVTVRMATSPQSPPKRRWRKTRSRMPAYPDSTREQCLAQRTSAFHAGKFVRTLKVERAMKIRLRVFQ